MIEIKPRMTDSDNPTCSGEACPASVKIHEPSPYSWCYCRSDELACVEPGELCIPGLRRLLATRTEERDEARRELCEEVGSNDVAIAHEYAASRGWSYLYAPAPPARYEE